MPPAFCPASSAAGSAPAESTHCSSVRRHVAEAAARTDDDTRKTLRELIERVVVKRPDAEGRIEVEVQGHLSDIVGEKAFPSGTYQGGLVVAGARYIRSPLNIRLPFSFTEAATR